MTDKEVVTEYGLTMEKALHKNKCVWAVQFLNDAIDAIEIGESRIAIRRVQAAIKSLT